MFPDCSHCANTGLPFTEKHSWNLSMAAPHTRVHNRGTNGRPGSLTVSLTHIPCCSFFSVESWIFIACVLHGHFFVVFMYITFLYPPRYFILAQLCPSCWYSNNVLVMHVVRLHCSVWRLRSIRRLTVLFL